MSKTISTLVPWFGSNRTLAENVGKALAGCEWVGVPFAGGMCELAHIKARTMLVSDLHRHVINLANVLRDPEDGPRLIRELRRIPFHSDMLAFAQGWCRSDESPEEKEWKQVFDYNDALNYFIVSWMGRNGTAGTDGEFKSGLSVRWNAAGGDSVMRFRNATEGLREWRRVFKRCTFVCMDVFDFLPKVKDEAGHGLYLDPPFPGPGDGYKHKFTEDHQRRLAGELATFDKCRVVCRFYDHPLIRELYPEPYWKWHHFEGRKQTNEIGPEVLLARNA